ncbi:unnamed protein product [Laminaria digitata]
MATLMHDRGGSAWHGGTGHPTAAAAVATTRQKMHWHSDNARDMVATVNEGAGTATATTTPTDATGTRSREGADVEPTPVVTSSRYLERGRRHPLRFRTAFGPLADRFRQDWGLLLRVETEEFMLNSRDEVLHLRTYAPPDGQTIKGLVIFVHGYGGHTNVPSKAKLGVAMTELGLAMVQLDLPGHGYSEGERAYITSYSHWLDDYFQLLEAVAGGGFAEPSKGKLELSASQLGRLKTVPFFLTGESLGGGMTLMMGLTIQDRQQHPFLPRFKGVGLIAPAIQGNPPPAPVVAALRYFVAPLIPRTQIPDALESVQLPEKVWKTAEDIALAKRDEWGNPGALGWGHNMKFNMGLNMMDMVGVVEKRLSDIKFPFIVMHDPEDAITQCSASRKLLEKASTPRDDPRARELIEMDSWLHDLLTNCTDLVIGHLTDWIVYQTDRAA